MEFSLIFHSLGVVCICTKNRNTTFVSKKVAPSSQQKIRQLISWQNRPCNFNTFSTPSKWLKQLVGVSLLYYAYDQLAQNKKGVYNLDSLRW